MKAWTLHGHEFQIDEEDYRAIIVSGRTFNAHGQYIGVYDPATQRSTRLQRILMPEHREIDHIDTDKRNYLRSNLRPVSSSINKQNKPAYGRHAKGVWHDESAGKYRAKIGYQGRVLRLGSYDTEREAVNAYNTAAVELYGEHAYLSECIEKCA